MVGYGQVTSGYGPATVLGALLVVILVVWTAVTARRGRRRRDLAGERPAAATPAIRRRGADSADTPTGDLFATARQPEPSTHRLIRSGRCTLLIAEALLVRERLAAQIDAPTCRSRMHDLASGRLR